MPKMATCVLDLFIQFLSFDLYLALEQAAHFLNAGHFWHWKWSFLHRWAWSLTNSKSSSGPPRRQKTDQANQQLKWLMPTYINTLQNLEMFDNDVPLTGESWLTQQGTETVRSHGSASEQKQVKTTGGSAADCTDHRISAASALLGQMSF